MTGLFACIGVTALYRINFIKPKARGIVSEEYGQFQSSSVRSGGNKWDTRNSTFQPQINIHVHRVKY